MASLPRYKLYSMVLRDSCIFFATLCLLPSDLQLFFVILQKLRDLNIWRTNALFMQSSTTALLKILSKKYSTKSDWELRIDLVRAWIEGQFHETTCTKVTSNKFKSRIQRNSFLTELGYAGCFYRNFESSLSFLPITINWIFIFEKKKSFAKQ